MNALIAFVCIAIFVAGLWCYGLAFQVEGDTLRLLVFAAGLLLNVLAFFIPTAIIGHSRK